MTTLSLEPHEALVLFDFLQREIDTGKAKRLKPLLDHPAEFWALNTVLVRVESVLAEPLAADYDGRVDAALAKVMAECDPEGTFPIGGEA